MKKGKAPNDTKLLFQARRYFARALCIKNPGAVANVGYAELIEATQGQRREDERGRSGARRYVLRMYAEAGSPAAPTRVKAKSKSSVMIEGVDVTAKDFLQTWAWRKLRYRVVRQYGARCMCCGATRESGGVIHVDHIKPRRLYPELALDLENLQILCGDCNAGKGNWDETDWRVPVKTAEQSADLEALAELRERGLLN